MHSVYVRNQKENPFQFSDKLRLKPRSYDQVLKNGLGLKTTAQEFLLYLCPQTSSCLGFIFFPNGHFDPFCREPTTNNLPAKTHQPNIIFGML